MRESPESKQNKIKFGTARKEKDETEESATTSSKSFSRGSSSINSTAKLSTVLILRLPEKICIHSAPNQVYSKDTLGDHVVDESYESGKIPCGSDSHWCYEIQAKEPNSHCSGPEQWTGDCKKNQQSPINIVTSKTKLNPSLTPFTFVGYDQKKKWEVKNNQHSVEMSLGEDIYIFGGDLPTQYKAIQLHLHWSEESNKGSEHSIDGKHFAMEMHVVHKKMTTGDKVQDSDSKDKIAVLAFMVEVGNEVNEGFQPLVEALSRLSKPFTNSTVSESCLQDMLPEKKKLSAYFRYQGSLTTPGCDETVIWTVFEEPIKIHKDQFLEFSKKLYYDQEQKLNMKDNVRPLQPLGNRQVFRSHASGRLLSLPLPTLLVPTLTCLVASFLH